MVACSSRTDCLHCLAVGQQQSIDNTWEVSPMCVCVCVWWWWGGYMGDQWVLGVMSKSSTLYLIVLKRFCSNSNTSQVHSLLQLRRNSKRLGERKCTAVMCQSNKRYSDKQVWLFDCSSSDKQSSNQRTCSLSNACLASLYAPNCLLCFANVNRVDLQYIVKDMKTLIILHSNLPSQHQ